jgi:5-oxoprolinase (ATP-hydrolysing)
VREGIDKARKILESQGFPKDGKFDYIHHGTTTATNAVLEGKGAKAGLIVTAGHKDILTVRRRYSRDTDINTHKLILC